ncbi:hypothetical protein ACJJTC_003833 [Scirpophaga incertulas]
MDWSNEKILEFISKYELEPVIWNPQETNYKKKHVKYEAWARIRNSLSWPVTVDELKNKMKSLMAYYRAHLNKYKKSLKSDECKDDVYQTNWFAFSAMNSFLGPVYECQNLTLPINEENETQNGDSEDGELIDVGHFLEQRAKSVGKKRNEDPLDITDAAQQPSQTASHQIKRGIDDEYDMFGKLIAMKIRKLNNPSTREIVMNDMFNLAFRAAMCDSRRHSTPSGLTTFLTQT